MTRANLFTYLFLFYSCFGFSQKITGKLIYLEESYPASANVYVDGVPDQVKTESIQIDGSFVFEDLGDISAIKLENLSGSIVLIDFGPLQDYDLGNLYYIDSPNNVFVHFVYKTKLGYHLRWLTEGIRRRRWVRKKIKDIYKVLRDSYNDDGKPLRFLKKYDGDEQILTLKFIED